MNRSAPNFQYSLLYHVQSKHPKLELDKFEYQLAQTILQHAKDSPVQVKTLVEMTGLLDPVVRSIVSDLVVIHGLPIGSRAGNKNPGYYWVETDSDLEKAAESLRRRGIRVLIRAQKLKKYNFNDLVGQLKAAGIQ